MQAYQLVIHHVDLTLGTPMTYSYYKDVKQSWHSVPRAGDQVLVGQDVMLPVAFVEFQPTKVRLHLHATSDDYTADDLTLAGFSRPA